MQRFYLNGGNHQTASMVHRNAKHCPSAGVPNSANFLCDIVPLNIASLCL